MEKERRSAKKREILTVRYSTTLASGSTISSLSQIQFPGDSDSMSSRFDPTPANAIDEISTPDRDESGTSLAQ